jgi:Cobalt uptake substrate-specific transmembrane region
MHIPDGFLNLPVIVITWIFTIGLLAIALKQVENDYQDRTVPLMGVCAAFIFAAQIATHDLDLALELCSRTIILSQGKIVYDGPTTEILYNADFLYKHALEPPLSHSRPYCDRPNNILHLTHFSGF